MNTLKALGKWLVKNSKWIVPIIIKGYEIISKRIAKKRDKNKPVSCDKISSEKEKQDPA